MERHCRHNIKRFKNRLEKSNNIFIDHYQKIISIFWVSVWFSLDRFESSCESDSRNFSFCCASVKIYSVYFLFPYIFQNGFREKLIEIGCKSVPQSWNVINNFN